MLMQQNMNGDTPLHIAVRMGSAEIVSLFTQVEIPLVIIKGVMKIFRFWTKPFFSQKNNTTLHEAMRYQVDSRVPQLLIRADPGFDDLANDSGETPLYLAVSFGTSTLVEQILKIRPTQSYGAPGGRTVLHALALQRSYSFGVKAVDINGRTALHYAVHSSNSEFVRAVLKVNPSVFYMFDKDGMTALHHAAATDVGSWSSKVEIMKIMLRHCMDCWEVIDNQGNSFLHIAAQNNNSNVIAFVLKEITSDLAANIIIGTKDKNGKTPAQINTEFSKILNSNARMRRIQRNWSQTYGISFDSYESHLNKQVRISFFSTLKRFLLVCDLVAIHFIVAFVRNIYLKHKFFSQ
ncbi:hypothetical protein MKW92_014450 [Papaver armeniacum]|nr:hypothetical protein MKW92_014450 [Papaver armeniacum]